MSSKLAKIEILPNQRPLDLLKDWIDDFRRHTTVPVIFSLATVGNSGDVKNRFIALQNLTEDGLVFNTNRNSPKVQQIEENPKVAACFPFAYTDGNTLRQVRIEGTAEKVTTKITQETFNSFPLHVKMRALLIPEQSVEVQWDELKARHDALLAKVSRNEVEANPPEHLVEYKILPKTFDFYHAHNEEIADRVFFKCVSGAWTHTHLTA
ncbi:pyridoxine/pyridoxamine 5'-phosphate oxidase-like [Euwallacea similis]|uniref:pyridoxine/pyridoxamine 5'-phosphate oxidase-like n=1 Tax=Euwallacea similis TaxID=1736056 RepID=UPI00344DF66B